MTNMHNSSGRPSVSRSSYNSTGRAGTPSRSGNGARSPYGRQPSGANAGRSYSRNGYEYERRSGDPYRRPAPSRNSRASSGNRQGYGAQNPRPRPGRRRKSPVVLIVLLVVALLAVIGIVRGLSGETIETERFVENVTINGISLAGMTREEGFAYMEEVRSQRLDTDYTLTYNGKSWSFDPASLGAELDFTAALDQAWNFGHVGDSATRKKIIRTLQESPVDIKCDLTFSESALDSFVQGIAAEVNVAAVDAEVTLTAEKPEITRQSQSGLQLNEQKTRDNIISLIETGQGDTQLPVETLLPTVASDGMNLERISKFSTDMSFRGSDSRGNVRLALNYFNALTVYPGETISFNKIVGPRTEATGFNKAPEYAGNETVEGVGGGVCQASTTLYNAVINAGMEIIERHSHSMTVSYVHPSQDAAVEYGSKDFVFRNDTDHPIYIYTEVTTEKATVTVYGTKPKNKYVLESIIVDMKPTERKRYVKDTSAEYCYYTTETELKTEGQGETKSQGWLVSYDWETGQEVSREQESYDEYYAGVSVYWRGVHVPPGQTEAY